MSRSIFWTAAILALVAGLSGCTRSYYRRTADKEVNDILTEKDKDPRWRIEQYHIYPDPRARFADPTNPDRPPMPPDDEGAWLNSPHPQKPGHHAGVAAVWGTGYLEMIKAWDAENRERRQQVAEKDKHAGIPAATKNSIRSYFDEQFNAPLPGFVLTMDQAIELGVVNSPQYQSFREQLYLAALPVTQQRFNFAYQWAATADWIREWAGPKAAGGAANNWTGSSTLGFSKLFATGALLTADFTNTTAFNFAGAASGLTSGSTINLNLAQPFLQGGGKAVTLEPLTLAERNLFYSIRAYARFREQFNVAVALGASLPNSLATASGNTSGPISVLAALGLASTDVSGGSIGYLPVLFRQCDLALDQKLVYDLQEGLRIIEAFQEGGYYSPLQVDQGRSQWVQAKNTVLADRQFVTNSLDQFKLSLGLPVNMPLILDDTPARPITTQLDRYYQVIDDATAVSRRIEKLEKQELLTAKEMRALLLDIFSDGAKSPIVKGTKFSKELPESWAKWRQAQGKAFQDEYEIHSKKRRELLDRKTDLELKNQTLSAAELDALNKANLEIDLSKLEKELREYDVEPWLKIGKEQDRLTKQIAMSRRVVLKVKDVLVYARNERFDGVFTSWPEVDKAMLGDLDLVTLDVDKAQELAVKAALENRLDLMNARAQVVDAWRQLRVSANALMGVATAQYTMQAITTPDGQRPLAFASDKTSQRLILNFQLPLNRLAERNAYRAALIRYQVARRSLMSFEDSIAAQVRFDVRQLQLFVANYEIQKSLLHSLYKQVDSALDVIIAPTDPDALKGSGTSVQANAAALTSQYLNSLQQLNQVQVRTYGIWLSIYATRMQLYLDLDRLPLDLRGVWVGEQPGHVAPAPADLRGSSNRDVNRTVLPVSAPEAVIPSDDTPVSRPVFLTPQVKRD